MKTLSIQQPWASLIAHGIKDVENRSWKINYRGPILIHASAIPERISLRQILTKEQLREVSQTWTADYFPKRPVSAIIGEAYLVDCIRNSPSIWAEKDCWHWIVSATKIYDKPILNVKGKLSLWEYEK